MGAKEEKMAANAENVAKLITSGIKGNNLIHDSSHLGINIKKTGFMFWKKTAIHVSGRVDTEKEQTEIYKIVDAESNGVAIVKSLRVERR